MVEASSNQGHGVAILLGRAESSACAEQVPEIRSQAFVHPQQIGLHGLFVFRGRQVRRPAVFPVPRVYVLVGEQTGMEEAMLGIDKAPLIHAAVVRFVVFQTKVRNMITEAVEKMIVAEVPGPEKLKCLISEILIIVENSGGRFEGGGAVGGNVHFLVWILGQRNNAQI